MGKPIYIEEYTKVLILFLQCNLFREPFLPALAIRANQIEVLKNIYQGGQILFLQKLATEKNMTAFMANNRFDFSSTLELTRLKNLQDRRNIQRLFGVSRLFRALAPFLTEELLLRIYELYSPRTTANLIDFIRKNGFAGLLKLKFTDESKSYLSRFLACEYPWYAAPGLTILKKNNIFTSVNIDLLLDYYAYAKAANKILDEDEGPKFAAVLVQVSGSNLLQDKELVKQIFMHKNPLGLAEALITFSKNNLLEDKRLIELISDHSSPEFFAEGLVTLIKNEIYNKEYIELIRKSRVPKYFAKVLVELIQSKLLDEKHIKLVEKSSEPEKVAKLLVFCKQQEFYNETNFEFIEKNCTLPIILRQWIVLIKNALASNENIALILKETNDLISKKDISEEVASLLEVLDRYRLVTEYNLQITIKKKQELIWKILYWGYCRFPLGLAKELNRLGERELLTQEIFHSIMKLTKGGEKSFLRVT